MHFKINDTDAPLIEQLPKLSRELLLGAADHQTYRQLAATYSIPIGTVRSRISRAKDKLVMMRLEAEIRATLDETMEEISNAHLVRHSQ